MSVVHAKLTHGLGYVDDGGLSELFGDFGIVGSIAIVRLTNRIG